MVRERIEEGDRVRLILDVWLENQRGEKVLVGSASGLAGQEMNQVPAKQDDESVDAT